MRASRFRLLAWLAASVAMTLGSACGSGTSRPVGPDNAATRTTRKLVTDRPPLELVERSGDPRPALAFASAHDLGSAASVAAVTVLEGRLRARGHGELRSRPHQLGFTLEALPSAIASAKSFVGDVRAALAAPVAENDELLPALAQSMAGLRSRAYLGAADAAVSGCSGELGVAANTALPDPTTAAGRTQINAWLARLLATEASAFAALGPASWLDAAASGLEESDAWPAGNRAQDLWPERDSFATDFVADGPRRLSVALRVANGSDALAAAEQLGRPSAALSLRLSALGSFHVERASGTIRPRGGCLRVDLSGPRAEPGPDGAEVSKALLITDEEMAVSLAQTATVPDSDPLLYATDPREAAIAAWRALSQQPAPKQPQRSVGYLAHSSERATLDLASSLGALQKRWTHSSVELAQRDEHGQGELWMLVASPCGTYDESADDAGQRALFVRALAREASGTLDVEIEPWISSDGTGLLGHAARRADESAAALARRVGSALGRSFLAAHPSGASIAAARAGLLQEIGDEPRPGYWLALDTVSPGRPSWLEPRGTFAALSDGGRSSIETQRRFLLGGPLRAAILTNGAATQGPAAVTALGRWLRAERLETSACPSAARAAPRTGEFTLSTSAPGEPEGVYLAISLAGLDASARAQAEATVWLCNRSGGWLDRALSGMTARARARLVGGPKAAALVVRLLASAEVEANAIAQVRGLFDKLARGAVLPDEVLAADKELARVELASSLDPRRRVVDLWRGAGPLPALDVGSLRAFHTHLGSPNHAVVFVRSRQ